MRVRPWRVLGSCCRRGPRAERSTPEPAEEAASRRERGSSQLAAGRLTSLTAVAEPTASAVEMDWKALVVEAATMAAVEVPQELGWQELERKADPGG